MPGDSPLRVLSPLEGRPWAPYVIASILGAAGGLLGLVHTNPWLALGFVLPDRDPATALERVVVWGVLLGGAATYATVPWLLRWQRWHEPLPPESPWPRAVQPAAWVTLVASWALLAQGHGLLDRDEPAPASARAVLAAAVVVGGAGLALSAFWLRQVRPWAAVATAGVVAACLAGPVVLHATSYADDGAVGWALLGGPSVLLLAAGLAVLAAGGGPVRGRRLWLGTWAGLVLAMLAASLVLLLDLDGQAEAARLAHEEAPPAPVLLLLAVLLAVAALRRR